MATVDVPWDWFVFKMKAYQYIVKIAKFDLATAYHFITGEGKHSLWVDSAPLACLGLMSHETNIVREQDVLTRIKLMWFMTQID